MEIISDEELDAALERDVPKPKEVKEDPNRQIPDLISNPTHFDSGAHFRPLK